MTSAIILLSASLSAAWILSTIARRLIFAPKADVPLVSFEGDNSGDRYINESGKLFAHGYEKYIKNGQPFAIRNPADPKRPLVILPIRYLEEVKSAPQDHLSFPASMSKSIFVRDICGPEMTDEVQKIARMDLNKALNSLIYPLQKVISEAFPKEIPPAAADGWASVKPFPLLSQIFARVAAYVVVGPELSQDGGRWIALSREYASAITVAPKIVRHEYHPYLRRAAKYREPTVKTVIALRSETAELVRPTLEKRTAELDMNAGLKHQDAIQWAIQEFRAKGKPLTPDTLVQTLFVTNTAAIDSTSTTGLWILLDLLQHPDALADIREEIARVRKSFHKDGMGDDFTWTRQSLGELRTLDSFMRESFRVHSFTQITLARLAVRPYTFRSSGLHLPEGTQIAFPRYQYGIDPAVNGPDPEQFDYKRHLRKRTGDNTTKFHFSSVSEDTLAWGAGIHACPGRFLAQEGLKLIFVNLVTRYEMKLNKAPGPDRMMGLFSGPDLTWSLLVREMKGQR